MIIPASFYNHPTGNTQQHQNNYQNSRDKIVESLKKETEEFSNSDNYDDDILILMLKNI